MESALLRASLAFKAAEPPPPTPLPAPPPQMGWAEACTHPMACLRAWRGSSVLHPPLCAVPGQPPPCGYLSYVLRMWFVADALIVLPCCCCCRYCCCCCRCCCCCWYKLPYPYCCAVHTMRLIHLMFQQRSSLCMPCVDGRIKLC